jgi:hypothetical protein
MSPFRDATALVEAEAAALEVCRRAELAETPRGPASLFVRRSARIAFGVAGTAGAACVALAMLGRTGGYAALLVGSWVAAVLAYGLATIVASVVLERRLRRAIRRRGEPFDDAAALRAIDPRAVEHELAGRRAHPSQAWPLVAASLLGPHTVHLLVKLAGQGTELLHEFDDWMLVSAALTPHVFVYGIVTAWTFPRRRKLAAPILIAGALARFPGILLLGIPSLIVMTTAAVLVLFAYLPMGWIIDREARRGTIDPCHLEGPRWWSVRSSR